jgi:hypothetical protein
MSYLRATGLIVFVALSAGCHRHHHPKGARDVVQTDNGGAPPPVAAPVDNRNAGQVVIDILTQQGYKCTVEETRWDCVSPNAPNWTFYVSFIADDTQTTIWLDSYALRAFGHPCPEFTNDMNDLAVPNDGFQVTCDDSSQQFRMNTALQYGSDLDVTGWTQNHMTHREASMELLRKAHAIRK